VLDVKMPRMMALICKQLFQGQAAGCHHVGFAHGQERRTRSWDSSWAPMITRDEAISPRELMAWVKAVFKSGDAATALRLPATNPAMWEVNVRSNEMRAGSRVELSAKEFACWHILSLIRRKHFRAIACWSSVGLRELSGTPAPLIRNIVFTSDKAGTESEETAFHSGTVH